MRTSVKFCRCPCSFLYCFFRFRWKTRILSPRPSPSNFGGHLGGGRLGHGSRLAAHRQHVAELDGLVLGWNTLSILTTSPGATRYCFPPVRITAYITNPPAPHVLNWRITSKSLFAWGGYRSEPHREAVRCDQLHSGESNSFPRTHTSALSPNSMILPVSDV